MAVNTKRKAKNKMPDLLNHAPAFMRNPRDLGRIGVLMGGPSTEREISLKSGKAVYGALKESGLDAVIVDINTDDLRDNELLIKKENLDCAFVALHGRFGEDGQIQQILDLLGIPYTGSGALASKLAMDKIASRQVFEVYGLDVPRHKILDKDSYNINWESHLEMNFPLVVKPATHGSSIGLSVVDKKEVLGQAVELAFNFDEKILIEEYIPGREVTVGVLDEEALPVIEIIPKNRFFDYEAKYQSGMTDYIVPAQFEEKAAGKIKSIGLLAHKLLGCSGCSRVDMIITAEGRIFILEVNTIPGLTSTSLLPKAAKSAGIEFSQLCVKLIQLAYEKE